MSLYSRLSAGLDSDESIVTPAMYARNPKMYDKITGIGYLVRENYPGAQLDWVWQNALDGLTKRADVTILAKMLIVRTRLPWNRVNYEWFISEEELNQNRDEYDVIDVVVMARNLETGEEGLVIDPIEFQENRDLYEVMETRYLVCWKSGSSLRPWRLDIDPDNIHTYMAE